VPVKIAERDQLVYAGQVSASGDTTLVAAVAGKQIVIDGYSLELRAAVATTALLKDGASGGKGTLARADGVAIGDMPKIPVWFPVGSWPVLTTNTALVLNLSAAQPVTVNVWYHLK